MTTITRTETRRLKADCFVVDYGRLRPNGWPALIPIDVQPREKLPQAITAIDRRRLAELKAQRIRHADVAERLGCSVTGVDKVLAELRRNEALHMKGAVE